MTKTTNAVPNPGSAEALGCGCTCPVLDNSHGKGMPSSTGPQFWISLDCPLHGTPKQPSDAREAAP